MMSNFIVRSVLFFAFIALALFRLTIPTHAADFVVTHLGDSGEGSLRQAIINANTDGVDSTITFAASANGTITLLSKLPALIANGTLTIEGNGQTNTIISGNDMVRVLHIHPRANVTISDLTITRGYWDSGGGIMVDLGTLNLNEVLVSNNVAMEGGGIYNREGTLIITGSSVSGNSAYLSGAGIFNFEDGVEATLAITDSTIISNTAVRFGGGIYSSGTMSITRSTIADNTADDYGGGISSEGELNIIEGMISGNTAGQVGGGIISQFAALTIVGSTINSNRAKSAGGGVSNLGGVATLTDTKVYDNSTLADDSIGGGIFTQAYYGQGALTLNNSTISGNISGWGGGISNIDSTVSLNNTAVSGNVAVNGGGIHNNVRPATAPDGSLTVNNSTIAANTASDSADGLLVYEGLVVLNNTIFANSDEDCITQNSGAVNANYSLFLNMAACGALESDGNLVGIDPLLGALVMPADGSPAYYPLLAGSPAIDAGSDALIPDGLTTDQAGKPRIFGVAVDMGSVEFPTKNLLRNAGFETAGANPSIARKWQQVGMAAADDRKCDTPTKRFAYRGSCAFQFKSGTTLSQSRTLKQKIDLKALGTANNNLTLAAWVRAKKLTAGAKLKITIRYADSTTRKATLKVPVGTYDYTRLTKTLTLTKAAVSVEIVIVAGPSRGTAFVDNLWLTIAPAMPATTVTRGADALLPPPAAPDGFRGSN